MTVIVGFETKEGVYIGGDSCISTGGFLRREMKVFEFQCTNNYILSRQ